MPNPSFALAGLIVVVGAVLVLAALIARAPLKQAVADRFERRQALLITQANAPHVVAALTISHRWRRVGLVVGLAAGILWSMKDGALTFNLLAGFLGWFAGAVVAQWRIGTLDQPGERRVASLSSH